MIKTTCTADIKRQMVRHLKAFLPTTLFFSAIFFWTDYNTLFNLTLWFSQAFQSAAHATSTTTNIYAYIMCIMLYGCKYIAHAKFTNV